MKIWFQNVIQKQNLKKLNYTTELTLYYIFQFKVRLNAECLTLCKSNTICRFGNEYKQKTIHSIIERTDR